MQLAYTKESFNKVSSEKIESKLYNIYAQEAVRSGWKIAFLRHKKDQQLWALFFYKFSVGYSLKRVVFDLMFQMKHLFDAEIVMEKSIDGLEFHKTSPFYHCQKFDFCCVS